MKTYNVTVRVSLLEYYEVEAASSEEALENWRYGQFLESGNEYLDTQPLHAEEVFARLTGCRYTG